MEKHTKDLRERKKQNILECHFDTTCTVMYNNFAYVLHINFHIS